MLPAALGASWAKRSEIVIGSFYSAPPPTLVMMLGWVELQGGEMVGTMFKTDLSGIIGF